jgi:hypothetical protein
MASTDNPENPLNRWSLTRFALDANGDGKLTTADLYQHLHALFFLPGDALLFALSTYAGPVARLFGFGPSDYGGVASGVLSACAWLIVLMVCSITYRSVRDFDRRVTTATRRLFSRTVLRVRIANALLRQRCRTWLAALRRERRTVEVPEVELSGTQLRVLQLHSALPPGHALTVSEVARAIGARHVHTLDLLSGLTDLGLLNRAMGGLDDETSYGLTAAGRALLTFRHENTGETPAPRRS